MHPQQSSWGRIGPLIVAAVALAAFFWPAGAGRTKDLPPGRLFRLAAAGDELVVVDWDRRQVRDAARARVRFRVPVFPLRDGEAVELELTPFKVTGPGTRFVLGRKGQADEPLDFDPESVTLLRGRVSGRPGSHVVMALSERMSTGTIDLGPGGKRYRISHLGQEGERLAPGRLSVFKARGPLSLPPDVPFCGVDEEGGQGASDGVQASVTGAPTSAAGAASGPIKGLKNLELAVETDHEYFILFGNTTDAATYLTMMYGIVSDIYIRDVDTRVELSFTRIWDNPADLFNDVDPSPLSDFRDYWNTNMGSVTRDAAQLFSGRNDYPFGGQAYLSALCGGNAYSVVGYAMGFFPDPATPSPYSYDISVTAHELGHNSGTGHTHDSPNNIDTCDDPLGTPQRGTIMSYCSQTWSGGNANRDLYFHSRIQQNMDSHIGGAGCVIDDCNLNSIADATDISQSTSQDVNSNSIPDECEDCNGNMVLDTIDIGTTSLDVDGNGVPDECQPDCNTNVVPDLKDIADVTSTDAYGNDIPDECEADCDTDSVSDYTEIQADMTLDVDRNAVLDACQDCDADMTTDLDALGGAHRVWVASGQASSDVREFHALTGVLTRTTSGGSGALVDQGQDLIIGAGGNVLVTSGGDHRVAEFDDTGSYLGDLVPAGSGGLSSPTGLVLTPDGNTLLVASSGTNSVLAYDATSGTAQGAFVTAGSGGLAVPFGLVFGPSGNLFVTSGGNQVLEYDGQNGSFIGIFVSSSANGGLDQARGMTFKPDGNLLVVSYGTNEVLEFDGQSGAPLGRWAISGTADRLTQISPWGVRVGPNGNVFVARTGDAFGSGASSEQEHNENAHHGQGNRHNSDYLRGNGNQDHDHGEHDHGDHGNSGQGSGQGQADRTQALHLTNAQIYEFDATTGGFLRAYIGGNDHGLVFPTGFAFVPGWSLDCNLNLLPDSCDISLGFSDDLDSSSIPDECETDCNGNGTLDRLDVIPYGTALDCNGNLLPDTCDVVSGFSADCTGNGLPDECEVDCNGNGVADSCDIDGGTSFDCNSNGIPDECDITDDLETGSGWTVGAAGDTAGTGVWTRVDPNGTAAQPEDDHTPGAGVACFVTGQGAVGGALGANDVDGGATTLISPAFDVSGDPDAEMGYWRWFSNSAGGSPNEDALVIDVSDDGGSTWTSLETVGPGGSESNGGWFFNQFKVSDFVTPTSNVVLRFVASDTGGGSIVEAAIDDLVILASCCSGPLPEVAALSVSPTGTQLDWTGQGGALAYDVIGDQASALRPAAGTAGAQCLTDSVAGTSWSDTRLAPDQGEGYYYLVRSQGVCGDGTYGFATAGGERLPTSACP